MNTMQVHPDSVTHLLVANEWRPVRANSLRLEGWGFSSTPLSLTTPMGPGVGFVDDDSGEWIVVPLKVVQGVRGSALPEPTP